MARQVMSHTFLDEFRKVFKLGPESQRVRREMYRQLAAGAPVPLGKLASALGVPVARAREMLGRATPSAAEFDQQGRVVAFGGLSLRPTSHRLQVEDQTLYTWCAFDTLFIPGMLGKRARVESTCPVSGRKVRLVVGPETIDQWEPAGAFVSLVVPDAEQLEDNVRGSFCCHVHFFAAEELARSWLSTNEGAFILPVTEAFELARSALESPPGSMQRLCPKTNTPGKPVVQLTVESLVREERLPDVQGREWAFCAEPACDVVYFAEDDSTLLEGDLTVRVGVKETEPPHLVCYCFGHTEESIREEVLRTGESTVVESVAAKVKANECSCETMNPKGTCCLGDLRRAVRKASR